MMRRVFPLALFFVPVLAPDYALAQWGRQFSIAAGPTIGIDKTPPDAGGHAHVAAAFDPDPRTLNLVADAYFSWMGPGTGEFVFPDGSSFFTREQEKQFGLALSGMLNFAPQKPVSPYLLLGVVSRFSDARADFKDRDPSGRIIDQWGYSQTDYQLDLLLGLGTAIKWGSRRLLLEARLYGGTAINVPLTIGLTL